MSARLWLTVVVVGLATSFYLNYLLTLNNDTTDLVKGLLKETLWENYGISLNDSVTKTVRQTRKETVIRIVTLVDMDRCRKHSNGWRFIGVGHGLDNDRIDKLDKTILCAKEIE